MSRQDEQPLDDRAVSSIVDPDKLGHVGPVADVRALLGRGRR